ncbi:hypothetical protein SteCoe_4331 [Stentor coeruleus]|uniref:RRM domain-containing protein n=1 Tax=Stentor coeruleus TaxID=5963 RepID=A0A1R2CV33_9CILI|nr:hypothetical protein SteCoe_4331 [Stentor coeruleus]
MSLLIRNISNRISQEILIEVFQNFGEFEICYFVKLIQGSFAFIKYFEHSSARNALLSLNGRIMAGSILYIEYCHNIPDFPVVKPVMDSSKTITANAKNVENHPIPVSLDLLDDNHTNSTHTAENLNTELPILPNNSLPIENIGPILENQHDLSFHTNMKNAEDSNEHLIEIPQIPSVILEVTDNCDKEKDKSNKQRTRKDKGKKALVIRVVGEKVLESYGSMFKLKKVNKNKDQNSIVLCELCQREFKMKSIRSHTVSLVHKSKIS